MKTIGDRSDQADIAGRLKWMWSATGRKEPGLISGNRILMRRTQ